MYKNTKKTMSEPDWKREQNEMKAKLYEKGKPFKPCMNCSHALESRESCKECLGQISRRRGPTKEGGGLMTFRRAKE